MLKFSDEECFEHLFLFLNFLVARSLPSLLKAITSCYSISKSAIDELYNNTGAMPPSSSLRDGRSLMQGESGIHQQMRVCHGDERSKHPVGNRQG